jgi:hypothetical protein
MVIAIAALGLLVSGCQFQAETPSGDVVQANVSPDSLRLFFENTDQRSQAMLTELQRLGNTNLARVMVEFRDVLYELRTMSGTINLDKAETLQRKLFAFEYQLSRDVTTPALEKRYDRVETLLRHLKKEMRRLDAIVDRFKAD